MRTFGILAIATAVILVVLLPPAFPVALAPLGIGFICIAEA